MSESSKPQHVYKAVFERGEQSGFVAYVPALPGCISQGATLEEAERNIREAMEGWIEAAIEHGIPFPAEDVIISEIAIPA